MTNNETSLARQPKPAEILRGQLDQRRELFALPAHISYERFCSVITTAVSMDPQLLSADRASLLTSCLQAAQDGLLLDKKQAALVIRAGRVTYMPMIAGVLKILRNSGAVSTIRAECVYAHDEFDYELGLNEKLIHRPHIDGDRGKLRCVYAIATLTDGSKPFRVMTLDQIDRRRAVSRSKSGPWVEWFDEMACKTVLRALCKVLPSSTDIDRIVDRIDEDVDLSSPERRVSSISLGDVPEIEPTPSSSSDGEVME